MTISVNVFDSAEIKEDQTTEFKESVFVDPETHNPGFRQMMTIAETLAAFMNADGGMLYVGIGDGKQIYGIGRDLTILATQPTSVALHSVRGNDTGHDYGTKASTDKYELKIRAIVKALLSPNASGYLGDVKTWKEAFGALLVKLNKIDKAKFDGIVADSFFAKWFVEVQPHRKYGDYFKDRLGTAANVRGYVKVGKVHFTNPDYVVHRLLARFGIEPSRVALRG